MAQDHKIDTATALPVVRHVIPAAQFQYGRSTGSFSTIAL